MLIAAGQNDQFALPSSKPWLVSSQLADGDLEIVLPTTMMICGTIKPNQQV
jgi:hypothetical protein